MNEIINNDEIRNEEKIIWMKLLKLKMTYKKDILMNIKMEEMKCNLYIIYEIQREIEMKIWKLWHWIDKDDKVKYYTNR